MLIGTSTVTSKGQVTIPVGLRKKFEMKKGSRVGFAVEGNGVNLKLIFTPSQLRGSLLSRVKYEKKKARTVIREKVVSRYLKSE